MFSGIDKILKEQLDFESNLNYVLEDDEGDLIDAIAVGNDIASVCGDDEVIIYQEIQGMEDNE